jgi:hypothetical protein
MRGPDAVQSAQPASYVPRAIKLLPDREPTPPSSSSSGINGALVLLHELIEGFDITFTG